MMTRFALLVAICLMTVSSGAFAQTAARPTAPEQGRELVYATHDGERLSARWYGPKTPGTYPTIIAVHGGAWQSGDNTRYADWGPYLAEHGYVVLAIRYRLSAPGRKSYPQAVHDVRAAVQYAKGNASELLVDPNRIALMGDSAGAHLAALVGLAGDHPAFSGAYADDPYAATSTKVKAVVGLYGVYDLLAQWSHDQIHRPADQMTEKFLGAKPMDDRRIFFEGSPVSYAVSSRNTTSFLLSWGTEDDIVDPETQSRPFLIALKQARFYVRTAIIPGAPHFWVGDPLVELDSRSGWLAPRLLRFLSDRL